MLNFDDLLTLHVYSIKENNSELSDKLARILRRYDHAHGDLKVAYETQGKIHAIRVYKDKTGSKLMEAKRFVEDMASEHNWKALKTTNFLNDY